jgi:hypothetical protein
VILGDLNFQWAELLADPIPQLPGQDVAALYDGDLTLRDCRRRKHTTTID